MPPVAQPEGKSYAVQVRYGLGVRKWPAILREFTGMEVTQSALTQESLKKPEGVIGNAYQELVPVWPPRRQSTRMTPVGGFTDKQLIGCPSIPTWPRCFRFALA
jgi:hypothetical protein